VSAADPPPRAPGEQRKRWWGELGTAAKWLVATVVAAIIGVLVPIGVAGVLDDDPEPTPTPTSTPTATATVAPARLVSAQQIGLFEVEANGSAEGARDAFGQPTTTTGKGPQCTLDWRPLGVSIQVINLGAVDSCIYGRFCSASIDGRDWATSKGLMVGESVRRLWELYPRARELPDGAIVRYVLERGAAPCGDAEGGLEAWASGGRVRQLHVSFRAAGD